ncbi:hypothetical protein RJ640_026475 [Escallonia rubra]|uniref:Uncharacterized protein n=1 Tax=Escallonia rubra TaxID=112253 RepID=A0AA88UJE0_9ASTE|nr:hypothetical protein RJ640_026475 [Escallonia rubra]
MFDEVRLSVSSYDTAWVAMVPSRNVSDQPCFPQCLDWILENQHPDGSWCLDPTHPSLVKDSLSSTLACVLALQKWQVGDLLVKKGRFLIVVHSTPFLFLLLKMNFTVIIGTSQTKNNSLERKYCNLIVLLLLGLDFIGSNNWATYDEHQYSPVGFDILYPGMLISASELGLNLPLDTSTINSMLRERDLMVKSIEDQKDHLAYVAEGLGSSYKWREALTYQRRDGSLFNSPSTTAAALTHLRDDGCFEYLSSVLKVYKNAVPTMYPLDLYTRLCMVDRLERLGVHRYFRHEIESVLDETYRCWVQRSEEIFSNTACCAMAFRLLRKNEFEISSDDLAELEEQDKFFKSVSPVFRDTSTVLELYRASQMTVLEKEPNLEKLHGWTSSLLKHQLLNHTIKDQRLHNEILTTVIRCSSIDDKVLRIFSTQDFNNCQAIHQKELLELERWAKDTGLDHLEFARKRLLHFYFSSVTFLYSAELSDARFSWTTNCFLLTILDDFFDVEGSREELVNLIELIEKWDGHLATDILSENVGVLFYSLYNTVNELAAKAFVVQRRCVKEHLVGLWLNTLVCMMKEAEWSRDKLKPTMEEYVSAAIVSIGYEPISLITQYFLGPKLSEDVVSSAEYVTMYKHLGTITRLRNDIETFKREAVQGKMNSVSLYVAQSQGKLTEEEAITKIREIVECSRRELRWMVTQRKNSLVPKACKDLFWSGSNLAYYYYSSSDELTSPSKLVNDANSIVYQKIHLSPREEESNGLTA